MNLPRTSTAEVMAAVPGTVWRHYKHGALYVVVGMSKLEKTGEIHVLYLSASGHEGPPWSRPLSEWLDEVQPDPPPTQTRRRRYVLETALAKGMPRAFDHLIRAGRAFVDAVMKDAK